jgi:hypothetical protein
MVLVWLAKWEEIFVGLPGQVCGGHFVPCTVTGIAHVRVPGQGFAFAAHSLAATFADTEAHKFPF